MAATAAAWLNNTGQRVEDVEQRDLVLWTPRSPPGGISDACGVHFASTFALRS
jgi:hypothetical protein